MGAIGDLIKEMMASGRGSFERQIKLTSPDNVNEILVSGSILKDDGENNLGMVLVFEDITYLQKAQRAAAWREVARRIAHEIKNPLTPIQLSAQRLKKRLSEKHCDSGRQMSTRRSRHSGPGAQPGFPPVEQVVIQRRPAAVQREQHQTARP